ncbi:MAG: hypothetical protein GXP35_12215 [Actinobacteria bacterium]|nr:hypothetical protein [Actinomycetota bacterium]
MFLYVDIEHASGFAKPHGDWLYAARARISYALEDVVGDDVHLIRYSKLDAEAMARLKPRCLLLSGNTADPQTYGPNGLDGLFRILTTTSLPVFGFCGGHQMLARAFGVEITRLGRADPAFDPDGNEAWISESGYSEVSVDDHPVFEGLGQSPIVRHAHTWEVPAVPRGFTGVARTSTTAIQAMAHEQRPIFGTQFHPEWWTDENPAGRRMIENFCSWAGLL